MARFHSTDARARPQACRAMGCIVLLALAFPSTPVAGVQTVQGVLLDEATDAPIAGAFVTLTDREGTELSGRLTDAAGRFRLDAPSPGRYGLRAERIGFETVTVGPVRLQQGERLSYRLRAGGRAVELPGLTVATEPRCGRPGAGHAAILWGEARKALRTASWAAGERLYEFDVVRYRRTLHAETERVLREDQRAYAVINEGPVRSRPARVLADSGWVRELPGGERQYFGPDADVLLSDPFLETHCFHVRPASGDSAWIGLAFEPVPGRDVPEVQGVLWLDRRTLELRRLDYGYTALPEEVDADRFGGRIEFDRLPTGAWVVGRWSIRIPVLGRRLDRVGPFLGESTVLVSILEEGGHVTRARTAAGEEILGSDGAALVGTVLDGPGPAPLAGAHITLVGTPHTAVTDEAGRFELRDVPPGRYTLGYTHARLDSLALEPGVQEVDLGVAQETRIVLAIPRLSALLEESCPGPPDPVSRTVVGRVRTPATGAPVAGARVVLSWRDRDGDRVAVEARTDSAGRYRICDAAAGHALGAIAFRGWAIGEAATIAPGPPLTRHDLAMAADLGSGPGHSGIAGFVREDVTRRPVPSALVAALTPDGDTVATAMTDSLGRYRLGPLPADSHTVSASRLGHAPATARVELIEGVPRELDFLLSARPVEVAPIVVAADAREPRLASVGFYERQSAGIGLFIDRAEIDARRPSRLSDLMYGKVGLQVVYPSGSTRMPHADVRFRGTGRISGLDCQPQILLDGAMARPGGTRRVGDLVLDQITSPDQVTALELYRGGAEFPGEIGGTGSGCGVIVIWTGR